MSILCCYLSAEVILRASRQIMMACAKLLINWIKLLQAEIVDCSN